MQTEAATRLLDYGVLGIMLVLFIGVIVYLQKQHKLSSDRLIAAKDKEIDSWKATSDKRDVQLDGVLAQLTANSTRQLDLYEHQQRSIESIPDRTVEKLQLALKK